MLNFDTVIRFVSIPYNSMLILAFIISGIILFFPNKRHTIKAEDITQKSAQKMSIIDVRDNPISRIPRSKVLNLEQLVKTNQIYKHLKNKDETIIIIAQNRTQALKNYKLLTKLQYKNVYILEKGIDGWKNAGLPLTQKALS